MILQHSICSSRLCTLLVILTISSLSACSNEPSVLDKDAPFIENAKYMQVTYQVNSNTVELNCKQSKETSDCYASTLSLNFVEALPSEGWYILFSHLSPVQRVNSSEFDIERINGDLHKITPKVAIQANKVYEIDLVSQFWMISTSDILPNYFFVFGDNKTAIIQSTVETTASSTELPTRPHAGLFNSSAHIKRVANDNVSLDDHIDRFEKNSNIHVNVLSSKALSTRIIPQITTTKPTGEMLDAVNGFSLEVDEEGSASEHLDLDVARQLLPISTKQDAIGIKINIDGSENTINEQGYKLYIGKSNIQVWAQNDTGAFYALVTLSQLLNSQNQLPQGIYEDEPKYYFRGVHLDVGRNFRSVDFVKRLITQMAYLKLNKLHLHLADDEGWRLEIDGLEELTQIGAYRCFDLSERTCLLPQLGSGPNRSSTANGFYSRSDYIDILKYAKQYHVEIIPSLDMPGHSRAAVKAMEARYYNKMESGDVVGAIKYLLTDFDDTTEYSSVQHYNDNTINPCMPSTYRFVKKVLNELVDMHNEANVKLKRYHIGADETAGAWYESPVCKEYIAKNDRIEDVNSLSAYFISRVAKIVENKGIIAGGWSDGMRSVEKSNLAPMQVNVWDGLMWNGHQAAYDFTEQGWRTVLSFPDVLYFDFPYAVDPNEPGYYWATRATDTYKVFQFTSDYPKENARLWQDRMGNPMTVSDNTYPNINTVGQVEGIQAHLWSEVVRHDQVAEYMYFPRLLSVAENAWANKQWQATIPEQTNQQWLAYINQDWVEFSAVLTNKVLPRLASEDINFRVPPPGAKLIDGKWHLNHLYSGMHLEYSTSTDEWQSYIEPITHLDNEFSIRAKVPSTQRVSKTIRLATSTTERGDR